MIIIIELHTYVTNTINRLNDHKGRQKWLLLSFSGVLALKFMNEVNVNVF